MTNVIYAIAVESFTPMLKSLLELVGKGAEHARLSDTDLVSASLAPDMFNFAQQIQRACYYAVDAVNRLRGQPAAVLEEVETSFAGLAAQISRTLNAVGHASPSEFEGADERDCTFSTQSGTMIISMNGLAFLRAWILPHFYFHIVTAYDILRHHGVNLGMKDLLMSAVGPYIEPPSS